MDETYELSGNLPWPERIDVNIFTNEFVQPSTINRMANRLLENDRFMYYNMLNFANSTIIDATNIPATSVLRHLKFKSGNTEYIIPVYIDETNEGNPIVDDEPVINVTYTGDQMNKETVLTFNASTYTIIGTPHAYSIPQVFLNGSLLSPSVDYEYDAETKVITFTSAPSPATTLVVWFESYVP